MTLWDELEQYAEQIVEKTGNTVLIWRLRRRPLFFVFFYWGVGVIIIAIINAIRALCI